MAQVKIEDIVDHLRGDIRRALQYAVEDTIDGTDVDAHALFRSFKRAVGRKCSTWEHVPDHYVRPD